MNKEVKGRIYFKGLDISDDFEWSVEFKNNFISIEIIDKPNSFFNEIPYINTNDMCEYIIVYKNNSKEEKLYLDRYSSVYAQNSQTIKLYFSNIDDIYDKESNDE